MRKINFLKSMALLMVGAVLTLSSCNKDDDNDDIIDHVTSGLYLSGDAMFSSDLVDEGLMDQGYDDNNEKEKRDGMFTKLLYLTKAGSVTITDVISAEEKVTIGNPIVAPADGFYYIIVDKQLDEVQVIPVETIGTIGAATPNGWNSQSNFALTTATKEECVWVGTDVKMTSGEFKFRFNEMWGVEYGDVDPKIKSFTDLSGTKEELTLGGDNMMFEDGAGLYKFTLTWKYDTGLSVVWEQTGTVAKTDWNGVILDVIGNGISSETPNAVVSTTWGNWGYTLLSDGVPTVSGDVYTWTFSSVILEAIDLSGDKAENTFKVRTAGGEAPADDKGANFDLGISAVDVDNSTTELAIDEPKNTDGNIAVKTKGEYKIIVTIDAANEDAKTVVITKL